MNKADRRQGEGAARGGHTLSRRLVLKVGISACAGLLVGCVPAPPPAAIKPAPTQPVDTGATAPTAVPTADPAAGLPEGSLAAGVWVRVDPDDSITVYAHKAEMGQGVHTAFAMLVAEELDVAVGAVRVQAADADSVYGNQLTGGSTSLEEAFVPLRRAAGTARHLLVAAAAEALGMDAASLRTEAGAVVAPDGRRIAFGRLAGAAAALEPPAPSAVTLKPREELRLIGVPTPRVDAPAKVDGSAVYGMDVRLPGMLYAVLAHPPTFGATLAAVDDTAALAVPGVRAVLRLEQAVAVVAQTTWAALQGRTALAVEWAPGPDAGLESAAIFAALEAGLAGPLARVDGGAAPDGVATMVEATYQLPFRAHAPMEPTSYTAVVDGGRAEIWAPTQDPQTARLLAAGALGLAADDVTLHVTFLGGGFGRRLRHDGVVEAALLAREIGAPLKLVYSREDELRHSFYHPASMHRLRAELDADGMPLSWRHALAAGFTAGGFTLGKEPPYRIRARRTEGALVATAVPQGLWRGVDHVQMVFATECFIDEIAAAAGRDPVELRRELIDDERLLAVLELAAERSGWGAALPMGRGRGVAVCAYNQTRVAQVAEVSVDGTGAVRVERIVVALDCGLPINPLGIAAQVEGAVAFALCTVLKGAVTIAGGAVEQRNFDSMPLLRIDEMPVVDLHLIAGGPTPFGVGEPPVPPVAPAVLNAIFAATGKRLRRLPVTPAELGAL